MDYNRILSRFFIFVLLLSSSSVAAYNQLVTIDPDSYITQNDTQERRDIVNFIVGQFKDLQKKTISQAEIDAIWNNQALRNTFYLGRFQIVDQKLYGESFSYRHRYFLALLEHFQSVLDKYKIPNVDFIVYLRDEITPNADGTEKALLHFPSFMMSKNLDNIYEKDKLLIPDALMTAVSRDPWATLLKEIVTARSKYPWNEKIDKIFWRGNASGDGLAGPYNLENYHKLPRITLVSLGRSYPDLIDAKMGFHHFEDSASGQKLLEAFDVLFGGNAAWVNEVDHLKFKYLASIDGNTCAWKRVPWIMASNSVLLLQKTNIMEWFYPAMKAYVHYVPMNDRLTDIFQKLEWMKTHDDEARSISQNAQNFIANTLTPEDIMTHTAIILNEYSKMQKDTEIKITTYSFDECMQKIFPPAPTAFNKLIPK